MRVLTRMAAIGVTAAALMFMLGTSAAYASYGSDGGITLSNTSPGAGGSLTVDSSGWKADSSVTITLHSTPVVLTTTTADANGAVTATVTIPPNTAAGSHTIELTGTGTTGAPQTMSTPLTVTSGGSGGGNLPRTGAAIAALFLVGIALFGIGSALSAARKRAVR